MWNAMVLSVGLVLGVVLSKIEYLKTVRLEFSISLCKEWTLVFFLAIFVIARIIN